MQTRSSSKLTRDQTSNPTLSTTTTPKGRNRRGSKQKVENSNLEENLPPVATMADNHTMAELLRAPTEWYAEAIVVPLILTEQFKLKHSLINMMTSDQFFRLEKDNPHDHIHQDSLNAAAGGNLLERSTQDVLTIIENKSKVRNSRSKPIASQVKACDVNSNSEIAKLTHAVNQQTSACLAAGSNTFPEFRDNIQGYVSTAAGLGSLPSNSVANPKGKLKSITTRSGLVTDGPTVPTPPKSITPEVNKRVKETYTDPDLAEYIIKVPPPPVQKYKHLSQRDFVVHKRDPPHPNIPYPSRMLKQKQQAKDEVQIQKIWQMFKQLHLNITLVGALVLMPKYQKMLKALLSNKEKLQELANTPLNENYSAVILKKLPEKLRDPGKFLILYGFGELKFKALANLCTSINLMPLSIWKELANFVIVDYKSNPRVPLILGRPFLRTARALIDVHGEEIILRDGDERLTLNMKHDTASYSNQPQRESVNLINIFNVSSEDFLEVSFLNQPSGNPTFLPHQELTSPEVNHDIHDLEGCNDIHPHFDDNPLSGSTTYFFNSLLEEFTDELALITYPLDYDDNLQFDIDFDLKEIEFLLYQGKDSSLKDSIDQTDLANLDDYFVDPMPEMFTDEHAPDYSSPPRFDVYDDDFLEVESNAENVYDDPFDSKREKIKESKLLIDELDLPCDFIPPSGYDSFNSHDFSRVDALPSTNNEDKVFKLGILIHEKPVKIITPVVQDKKLAIFNASLVFEDFDPPFYEPLFFKDVSKSKMLLLFSSENEEKVFKPGIYTSEKVYSCFIPELSHPGYHVFKVNQIFISLMKIFLVQCGKNTPLLDVPLFHFYPP
uniref:Reverse transcriptase domain-containing protein n=1 Tax=Tanacetum cinerariifolium TaxID=118510 RepID=A0A6L2LWF2_TANCI|nr:reverse transcriptase domain-containing protein [Tanacetum cinerariifolium]